MSDYGLRLSSAFLFESRTLSAHLFELGHCFIGQQKQMVLVNNTQSHNGICLTWAYRCVPIFTPCKQQLGGNILINHAAISSPDYGCTQSWNVQIKGLTTRMPDYDGNSMPNNCGLNTDINLVGWFGVVYYRSPRLYGSDSMAGAFSFLRSPRPMISSTANVVR